MSVLEALWSVDLCEGSFKLGRITDGICLVYLAISEVHYMLLWHSCVATF